MIENTFSADFCARMDRFLSHLSGAGAHRGAAAEPVYMQTELPLFADTVSISNQREVAPSRIAYKQSGKMI